MFKRKRHVLTVTDLDGKITRLGEFDTLSMAMGAGNNQRHRDRNGRKAYSPWLSIAPNIHEVIDTMTGIKYTIKTEKIQ